MIFEDVLEQYEPMISASIRKLNIYRDHEQYRQAGRVALWQAWHRFDENKGNFTAFAFRSIRGAMLDELKKESRFEEHNMPMEDELVENVVDLTIFSDCEWSDGLAEALALLSNAELELVHWLFVEGLSLAECATRYGITVAGIKKRRERMLVKLRNLLAHDKYQ
ncbi:sigma-70 family RNA polymerase sigma factor [Sporosarcina sp. YIM B06819]|uniref:sigma-70 family RNA polymerase sigma factor n=1 Tax=Sporosarcina sp. YIM B06819 TaxID=3081769 RepID=UPI00298CD778|nr:sigma-70 family RNA polymerase sigma factor [Sporosarcina sp. YIM B06819]